MRGKIRCDGESWIFFCTFWELNKALSQAHWSPKKIDLWLWIVLRDSASMKYE
jgi:hypothetical protein